MRIEIDTKHDSKEEILHAIKALQSIVNKTEGNNGEGEIFTNEPSTQSSSQTQNEGYVNLFAENKPIETEPKKEHSYVNMFAENPTPAPQQSQSEPVNAMASMFIEDTDSTSKTETEQTAIQEKEWEPYPNVQAEDEDDSDTPKVKFY